jgi:hypothetical protein
VKKLSKHPLVEPEDVYFHSRCTSLQLSDIYLVLGYYLRHKAEVDAYLLERQRQAAVIRQEAEQRFNPVGIRDRLLARQSQHE